MCTVWDGDNSSSNEKLLSPPQHPAAASCLFLGRGPDCVATNSQLFSLLGNNSVLPSGDSCLSATTQLGGICHPESVTTLICFYFLVLYVSPPSGGNCSFWDEQNVTSVHVFSKWINDFIKLLFLSNLVIYHNNEKFIIVGGFFSAIK